VILSRGPDHEIALRSVGYVKLPLNLVIIVVIPLQSQLFIGEVKLKTEALILSGQILDAILYALDGTLNFHQTILPHNPIRRGSKVTFLRGYKQTAFFNTEDLLSKKTI